MSTGPKRPAPLDLSRTKLSVSMNQNARTPTYSELRPQDSYEVLMKSREISLQQQRIIDSATTVSSASTNFSSAGSLPSANSTVSAISSVDSSSTSKNESSIKEGSSGSHVLAEDDEGSGCRSRNGPGRLPSRKRMRRHSPPKPLHISAKSRLLSMPIRSAPVYSFAGHPPVGYQIPMRSVTAPIASCSTHTVSQLPALSYQFAPMMQGGRIIMVPPINQTPVTVQSDTVQSTVRDVYAGQYVNGVEKDNDDKGERGEVEDDVESKAIEDDAKVQSESLKGILQIGDKAYNYSVVVTGNEKRDNKHFHDVMNFISNEICSQYRQTLRSINFVGHRCISTIHRVQDHDEKAQLIRQVFDDQAFWNDFNNSGQQERHSLLGYIGSNSEAGSVGLFENPYLKKPSGLRQFSAESLEKAQLLTQHIIDDDSPEGLRNCVRNLDRLSDVLCRVIDLCEFVRVVHPNQSFVKAAQQCHEQMFEFMNILNTSKGLFDKLSKALHDDSIKSRLTDEEFSVGKLLYADFKQSGIDMDEKTRQGFVELSQYIAMTGQSFNNGVSDTDAEYAVVPKEHLRGNDIPKEFEQYVSYDRHGNLRIPVYGRTPYEILRSCKNRAVRERIWVTLHSVPHVQIQLLERFLKSRGVLARMMGKQSYADYQLGEKMAKNPANVMIFLQNLLKESKKGVAEEVKTLYGGYSNPDISNPTEKQLATLVRPWDRDYLTTLHMVRQKSSNLEDISAYFSVGTVVAGLSNLFKAIYGIELHPKPVKRREIWSDDVRKFEVVSEDEGLVGIIYMDLFYRENKTPTPAHFTVCCSRKIYPEELDIEDPFNLKKRAFQTTEHDGEIYQLPVISLVCNFFPEYYASSDTSNSLPTLLTLNQVETLFHEMGHAIHSMLGRTNLHNVSGTRCVTDFVELPSILTEQFAKDERVLLSFARHYKTGEPLPLSLLRKHENDNNFLNHSETFGQIKMAMLDEILHSSVVFAEDFDAVKIYHRLEKELVFFNDSLSNWPGRFGHLYSYGSVYYSYLLDRAIAAKIWDHLFADDPMNRASGQKFKNEVLKWGGCKDPWSMVAAVLDRPELKRGDLAAMEYIGSVKDI
ncbi:hypothetical protein FOA43_000659 [Brettanomyces nanus]|uniref:Mitochondrial intermediate peptidase n=1 Tax=Eeniella nana TaxID=13502 RepID=A0A875S0E3_EENNA|nr:uncharacterized protein FOA43_000659 [Brettanomyces nanus]QPG73349.1 hypothetical protein FOA43_000659 [Brettanomyces nanus]